MIARTAAAVLLIAAILAPGAGARLTEPPVKLPDKELFYVPLNGNLGSPFAHRWGRFHEGIDIEGWAHTKVYAALSGEVIARGWLHNLEGYGLVVLEAVSRGTAAVVVRDDDNAAAASSRRRSSTANP